MKSFNVLFQNIKCIGILKNKEPFNNRCIHAAVHICINICTYENLYNSTSCNVILNKVNQFNFLLHESYKAYNYIVQMCLRVSFYINMWKISSNSYISNGCAKARAIHCQ